MKKVLICLTMIVAVTLMVASVQAVPVWLNAAFCQTCAGKVAPGYNDSLDRYSPLAVDTHGRLILSGELDLSGASFTPDTASINHTNKILEWGINAKLARADSTADSTSNRVKYTNNLILWQVAPMIAQAESILAVSYTQAAGAQSRDSTIQATNLPSLPLLYTQAAGQQDRDSTILISIYNRLREIADKDSALSRLTFTADSLLDLTRAKLDAIALRDSTGNNAYSKYFRAHRDTLSPGDTLVIKLNTTLPYSPDYRIHEFSWYILGDTVDIDYYSPWSTVTTGPPHYPGEALTLPVQCDSVVVSVPIDGGIVPTEVDFRWWVRGR